MLKLRKREATLTLDVLPGIKVTVPLLNIAILRAAETAGHRAMADYLRAHDAESTGELSEEQSADLEGVFAQARISFLAGKITGWEGIGDDEGVPVDPTPEYIAMFVAEPRVATAFLAAYDASARLEISEGNGSGASGTGEPAAAPNTAAAAKEPAESAPA